MVVIRALSLALLALSASVDARNCGAQERYTGDGPHAHSLHKRIERVGHEVGTESTIPSVVTIPIVYNIYTDKKGNGDVSDERIAQQTATLNAAYANTAFQFTTAAINRAAKKNFYNDGMGAQESKMKKQATKNFPTTQYFHVYSVNTDGGILGFATFPDMYPEDSHMHGVVLWGETMFGSAAPYDLGDTLVHEVGHYLGLFHTWGNCVNSVCTLNCDDGVSDTPWHTQPDYECNERADGCTSDAGLNPVHNFMNYGDDVCLTEFTAGQAQRMVDEMCAGRPTMIAAHGGRCI